MLLGGGAAAQSYDSWAPSWEFPETGTQSGPYGGSAGYGSSQQRSAPPSQGSGGSDGAAFGYRDYETLPREGGYAVPDYSAEQPGYGADYYRYGLPESPGQPFPTAPWGQTYDSSPRPGADTAPQRYNPWSAPHSDAAPRAPQRPEAGGEQKTWGNLLWRYGSPEPYSRGGSGGFSGGFSGGTYPGQRGAPGYGGGSPYGSQYPQTQEPWPNGYGQ